jgi:hypothetical protein
VQGEDKLNAGRWRSRIQFQLRTQAFFFFAPFAFFFFETTAPSIRVGSIASLNSVVTLQPSFFFAGNLCENEEIWHVRQ